MKEKPIEGEVPHSSQYNVANTLITNGKGSQIESPTMAFQVYQKLSNDCNLRDKRLSNELDEELPIQMVARPEIS